VKNPLGTAVCTALVGGGLLVSAAPAMACPAGTVGAVSIGLEIAAQSIPVLAGGGCVIGGTAWDFADPARVPL